MPKKKRKEFLNLHIDIRTGAKDKFKQAVLNELAYYDLNNLISNKEKNEYAEREYQKKLDKYYKNLDLVAKSILERKYLYCDELTMLIGDIDFIFDKKQKERIHKNLYIKLIKQVNYIRQVAFVCDSYLNDDKDYDRLFTIQNISNLQKNDD